MLKSAIALLSVFAACKSDENPPTPTVRPDNVTNDVVRIPGGTFIGRVPHCDGTKILSPPPQLQDGDPRISVTQTLPPFEIDRNVVSCSDMQDCVSAGHCKNSSGCLYDVANAAVVNAMEYCAWRGMRLVKYAEWQRAIRWTDGRLFPTGMTWEPSACPPNAASNPEGCKLKSPDGVEYAIFHGMDELTSDTECAEDGASLVPLAVGTSSPYLVMVRNSKIISGRFRCAR